MVQRYTDYVDALCVGSTAPSLDSPDPSSFHGEYDLTWLPQPFVNFTRTNFTFLYVGGSELRGAPGPREKAAPPAGRAPRATDPGVPPP